MALRPDVEHLAREGDLDGLRSALHDDDPDVRRAALVVLADGGFLEPVAAAALESPHPDSRAVAAELLAQAPDAALTPLLDAAGDPARRVQAAEALGATRHAAATPVLMEMLQADAAPARAAAAAALGRIQDPRAAEALIGVARDSDATVSAAAKGALADLGAAAAFGFAARRQPAAVDPHEFADSVGWLLDADPATAREEAAAPAPPAPSPTVPPVAAPVGPSRGRVPTPTPLTAFPAAAGRRRPPRLVPVALVAFGALALIVVLIAIVGGGDDPAPDRSVAGATPTATAIDPAQAAAARRRAGAARRRAGATGGATVRAHDRLETLARAAATRRIAARRRPVAATPAPTAAPAATDTPAPVRTAAPTPAPTRAPPKPQPTPRPQPTPEITQPDPIP